MGEKIIKPGKARTPKRVLELFLAFLFVSCLILPSQFSISPISFNNTTVLASESADDTSPDAQMISRGERQDIQKADEKSQKKLRELNAPILPAANESAEEKIKRRQEAKERLEYFKQEVEKKRKTLLEEGSHLSAQEKTSGSGTGQGVKGDEEVKDRQEAVQKELKKHEALLAEKDRLERELKRTETTEERKARLTKEKAQMAAQEKERKLVETRKKAELKRQVAEKRRQEEALKIQKEKEAKTLRLEAEKKKAEAKRSEEAKRKAERERAKQEREQAERERLSTQKQADLEKKNLEMKKNQEAALRQQEARAEAEKKRKSEEAKNKQAKEAERANSKAEKERKKLEEKTKKENLKKQRELEKARRLEEAQRRRMQDVQDRKALAEKKAEADRKKTSALKISRPALNPEDQRKAINSYLKQSQQFIDQGLYGPARFRLERVLQADPDNVVAKNLMAVAVEGEFVANQGRAKNETMIAREIEEDQMRQKFLDTMDRIDRETQSLTEEGNALYQKGSLTEANLKYKRVLALQAERQAITEGLIGTLKARQVKAHEEGTPADAQARKAKVELLMKEAGDFEKKGEWDQAAERYESVFTLDPLNSEASRGIDRMKKRFLTEQKKKDQVKGKELEARLKGKVDFYISQAEKAEGNKQPDIARVFLRQALDLDQGNRKVKGMLATLEKEEMKQKL